jgi:hypothetical protein
MGWTCSHGREKKYKKKLVAKYLRKYCLGRTTSRWYDNIKAVCEVRTYVEVVQDHNSWKRFVRTLVRL